MAEATPIVVSNNEEDTRYAAYMIAGTDARGHNERKNLRLQPVYLRQAEVVLGAKKFPFRSIDDVFRYCIHVGLQELLMTEEEIPSVMAHAVAINEMLRHEEMNKSFGAVFSRLNETMAAYSGDSGVNEQRRLVIRIWREIEQMPEGYWKDRYRKQLMETYGHLIDGADRVSLMEMEEDE
jgi:hypothetical protein